MCFSIPYKVTKVVKNKAFLENGKFVKIDKELSVRNGEYLQVVGEVAIAKLSNNQGLKIRKLIKSLNSYEPTN